MSGHSRWSNIKHRKAKGDAAKAKIYTKIGRELMVAVKQGGADPASNSKLKELIAKAKTNNIPNDNITRIIKKATGELGNINYENITYEGYGIGGVAVIAECLTDNKNRTAADVRHFFDKYGGSLGTTGCVSFMFESKGVVVINRGKLTEDDVMELALNINAGDYSEEDGIVEFYTETAAVSAAREYLEANNIECLSAEVDRIPQNYISVDGDNLIKLQKMLEIMEECDDIQNIYHNADLPEIDEEE